MKKESPWTPALVEQLKALWAEGLSTPEIARVMGMGKGQIIGKAHRLHLEERPSPLPAGYVRSAPTLTRDLGCRWIEGDPPALKAAGLDYDQMICGKKIVRPGGSYCENHHARCYTVMPSRNHKPFVDLQSAPRGKAA